MKGVGRRVTHSKLGHFHSYITEMGIIMESPPPISAEAWKSKEHRRFVNTPADSLILHQIMLFGYYIVLIGRFDNQ